MNIAIIGATGRAGQALYTQALQRGHKVTAIVRDKNKAQAIFDENVSLIVKDAFAVTKDDLLDFDVIVNAFATPPQTAYLHVDLATHLVHELRDTTHTRLFFILGAGSLLQANGSLLLDTLKTSPQAATFIPIPIEQAKELTFLRLIDNVKWVGISPGIQLIEGDSTDYLLGTDHLLQSSDGESVTTYGTLARAILDEIESPKHHKQRFTVINRS